MEPLLHVLALPDGTPAVEVHRAGLRDLERPHREPGRDRGPGRRTAQLWQAGVFRSGEPSNGTLLWKQGVGKDPGSGKPVVPYSRALFSADGTLAFASAIVSGVYDHSFVFGLKTT